MKKTFIGIVALIAITTFLGCNTMQGAGKDVENTGRNIQQTVERNN